MITISVSNLGHKFDKSWLFENLNFSFSEGIIGISGKNGSGKTTLLKILRGLVTAKKGNVVWTRDGNDIPLSARSRISGYSGPYMNFYDELTVSENLIFCMKMLGLPSAESLKLAVSTCGLESLMDKAWKTLSSGQQQRVRLALSILNAPEVLFLDEPGSNLDDVGKSIVETLIKEQQSKLAFIASNESSELNQCTHIITI